MQKTSIQLIQTEALQSSRSHFIVKTTSSNVTGKVLINLSKTLNKPKITLNLVGSSQTKWSGSDPYKVTDSNLPLICSREFLNTTVCIRDRSKSALVVSTQSYQMPFNIQLPNDNLPPTTTDRRACIKYVLTATITYSNSIIGIGSRHIKTSVPVLFVVSNESRLEMLANPMPLSHHLPPSPQKCDVVVTISNRSLLPSDFCTAEIDIKSIPQGRSIRYVDASIRSSLELRGSNGLAAIVQFPRPLDEMRDIPTERNGYRPVIDYLRSFKLLIDESLARPTVDSIYFSVKTVFRFEIVLYLKLI